MSKTRHYKLPQFSDFPPEEVTPAVLILLEICHQQQEEIQALRDEIAPLKSQTSELQIRASELEGGDKKNRGSQGKQSKTGQLEIHETVLIRPNSIPQGSQFKDYQDFTVQDIRIALHNTCYRLERWMTPSGEAIIGKLPCEVAGHRFGANLRAYILYQYHYAHVSKTLILEQLRKWKVQISTGEISTIITEGKDAFHAKNKALSQLGLQCSAHVQVDDIEACHTAKNASNRAAQIGHPATPTQQEAPILGDPSYLALFDVLADIASTGVGSPTEVLSPVIYRAANRAIRFKLYHPATTPPKK